MDVVIPRELKIGGHTFRIVLDEGIDSEGRRAMIDFRRLVIIIHPNKKESVKSEGLIHEILHAIDEVYLNRQIDSDNIMEPLAEGLWRVIEQLGIRFDWGSVLNESRRD